MDEQKEGTIDKAVGDFEKEQKRHEIALKVSDGNEELAQQLLTGQIRNIGIIKCFFKDGTTNLSGLFIAFIDLDKEAVDRIYCIVSFDTVYSQVSPYVKWSEFEKKIIELEWQGVLLANQSDDLKKSIHSMISFDYKDRIKEYIKDNNTTEIKEILSVVINKSLGLDNPAMEVGIELINKLIMALEGQLDSEPKEKPLEDLTEEEEGAREASDEVILEGSLVIAPIRGINITQIQTGMPILVKLPAKTSKDKYYLNLLNAVDDQGNVHPVTITVKSIDYDDISGYMIIGEVQPGIIVRCLEQSQINIMTPGFQEEKKKVNKVRLLLIIGGAVLLLLSALIVYLSLKGYI